MNTPQSIDQLSSATEIADRAYGDATQLWASAIGGGCVVFGFWKGFESAFLAGTCIVLCAILMACITQCLHWLANNAREVQE